MRAPEQARRLIHLAQFDQVPVGVSEKAPNLPTPVIGRSQKLGASLPQGFVGDVAVVHPKRHGVAHSVRLRWWDERDLRFVGCRRAPGYEQHPRPTETKHDARFVLAVDLSAKNLGPKGSRSPSVSHDEDLSDIDAREWIFFGTRSSATTTGSHVQDVVRRHRPRLARKADQPRSISDSLTAFGATVARMNGRARRVTTTDLGYQSEQGHNDEKEAERPSTAGLRHS